MDLLTLANAGLAAAVFLVAASPGLLIAKARGWVLVVFAIALVDSCTTLLPIIYKPLDFIGGHWNWVGKIFNISAMLAVAALLSATRKLSLAETGLTLKQAPGTGGALLFVILPYLVLMAALAATLFGNAKPPPHETIAYQATMPGLAEELSYRGLQLAIFNRMFSGRVRILGAEIGYGALAVSVAFGLLHGVGFDKHFHLQASWEAIGVTGAIGFVLAWLRERTRSLALPVVIHNATNLILECVPKLA